MTGCVKNYRCFTVVLIFWIFLLWIKISDCKLSHFNILSLVLTFPILSHVLSQFNDLEWTVLNWYTTVAILCTSGMNQMELLWIVSNWQWFKPPVLTGNNASTVLKQCSAGNIEGNSGAPPGLYRDKLFIVIHVNYINLAFIGALPGTTKIV